MCGVGISVPHLTSPFPTFWATQTLYPERLPPRELESNKSKKIGHSVHMGRVYYFNGTLEVSTTSRSIFNLWKVYDGLMKLL